MPKVVISGGGLVGALNSLYMAKRGFEVDLFEARKDIRTESRAEGVSINLALSERGRNALREVGLEDEIVAAGIPMYARMLHAHDGRCTSVPYGKAGQGIIAIDRKNLNELLLTAVEKHEKVNLHFNHKLTKLDPTKTEAVFTTKDGQDKVVKGDMFCGCDGAYSASRRFIMRHTRMDYSQEYIEHGYKELTIKPKADGSFKMEKNYLHIWPRHTFMMIALPNNDGSFTLTLFMPFTEFEKITTEEQVMEFFQREFPDSIPLIGEEDLKRDFFHNKTSSLVLIKCKPYHASTSVIMGDAAHAMVPFYGQGMNAGFEDVFVLKNLLDKHENDFAAALEEYSAIRYDDAVSIVDLALYNYKEMRDLVTSKWFLFRKKVDNFLNMLMPNTFIPLYTMVTFTRIPYAEVIKRDRRQKAFVNVGLGMLAAGALAGGAFAAAKHFKKI